jgi:putative ABC transport system permease protein
MEWGPILRAMLTHKARFGLIAMQIAATFAIVANCVALIREAREKLSISSGLDDEHFVSIAGRNPLPKSRGDVERKAWMLQTSEELRRISGVSSSSLSSYRPWACSLRDLIKAANTNTEQTPIGSCLADELLAETIGLTLEEGRWFSHEEVYGATHNIVITR